MTARASRYGFWVVAAALAIFWALSWWPTRPRTVAELWIGDLPAAGRVWVEWPHAGEAREARVWSVGSVVPQGLPLGGSPNGKIVLRVRPDGNPVALELGLDADGLPVVGLRAADGTLSSALNWRRIARVRERRAPAGWVWRGWGARLVPVVRWPEPLESGPAARVLAERIRRESAEYLDGTRRGIWTESFRRLLRRQPGWERSVSREWQLMDLHPEVVGVLRRDRLTENGSSVSSWRGDLALGSGAWLGGREPGRMFRDAVDWRARLGPAFEVQLAAQGAYGRTGIGERLTTVTWADDGLVLLAVQPGGSGDRLFSAWLPATDLDGDLSAGFPVDGP